MKNISTLSVILLLIGSCIMARAGVVQDRTKSLEKVLEVQSDDCIKGFHASSNSNDELKIDRVVTINSVSRLDQKGQLASLFDRTTDRIKVPGGAECPDLHSFFSPDGKYFIEQITCGPECAQTRVVDMETKKSIIPKESSYPSAATDSSFITLNIFANEARLFDYAGNELQSLPELFEVQGHEVGYVGYSFDSKFYFLDKMGNVLNSVIHHSLGITYDVDALTGVTAILIPKPTAMKTTPGKSVLKVLNKEGKLLFQELLPYTGYTVGVGVAHGGEYVSIVSEKGWVKQFSVKTHAERWSSDFEFGWHFCNSRTSLPVSEGGEYTIVYGRHPGVDKGTYLLLVFDKSGELVATLEPPVSKSMILTYHVSFLVNETSFVTFSGNELVVYAIK